jgi:hypothetical protein
MPLFLVSSINFMKFVDDMQKNIIIVLFNLLKLYSGGQCYWLRKAEYPKKTTDQPQLTDRLYHIMLYRVHLTMNGV